MHLNSKYSLVLLVGFVSLLLHISCEKDPNIKGGYQHHLIDEGLRPLLFNTGSYWIYENTADNGTDTITLLDYLMDTVGPYATGNGLSASQQVFIVGYHSSATGYFEEQFVTYVITRGNLNGGYIYLAGKSADEELKNARVAQIHDSLEVNGKTYYQVTEMDVSDDNYFMKNTNLFFVDSVGIVKKEIIKNYAIESTWVLINSETSLLNP